MSLTPEPDLIDFLLSCADHEADRTKRDALRTLVGQWRQPAPRVKADDVWDAMTYASRAYPDAPGYQERWER